MPFMPAVCYACHTIFSSGLFVRDIRVNLTGIEVQSCPNCLAKGRIIGGMYEFIDYTLKILKANCHTFIELKMFQGILETADQESYTPVRLEVKFNNFFPEFRDLLILLPDTLTDYKLCLNLLLQIVTAIIERLSEEDLDKYSVPDCVKTIQKVNVNQTIDQIYTINTGVKKRFL